MLKAVLDTNVVISALLTPEGPTAQIIKLAMAGEFRCFVSHAILEEYREVLTRPRFGWNKKVIGKYLKQLNARMELARPTRKVSITSDPADNKMLECALAARADYVVTGNTRHFPLQYQDVRILSPRTFLTELASSPNSQLGR